jgi:hypothetical protein
VFVPLALPKEPNTEQRTSEQGTGNLQNHGVPPMRGKRYY